MLMYLILHRNVHVLLAKYCLQTQYLYSFAPSYTHIFFNLPLQTVIIVFFLEKGPPTFPRRDGVIYAQPLTKPDKVIPHSKYTCFLSLFPPCSFIGAGKI